MFRLCCRCISVSAPKKDRTARRVQTGPHECLLRAAPVGWRSPRTIALQLGSNVRVLAWRQALVARCGCSDAFAKDLLAQASEIRAIANERKRGEADFAHRRDRSVKLVVGFPYEVAPRATQR